MLHFILMLCGILIFVRIYLNKYDIKGKDIISIVIAFSLTAFLNLIQFLLDLILQMFL